MQRRHFFQLLAAAAALPGPLPLWSQSPAPAGWDRPAEDYAAFCATPEARRRFYALSGKQIVREKLDPAAWHPTGWGKPPQLPVPGGSWDGVPMRSPLPGLAGEGPFQGNWESLKQYQCPEWYRDAKFAIWNHWSPQCVPEDGDWFARNMYLQGSSQNRFAQAHYGPPSKFGYKDLCAQWTLLNWEPSALMERYKRAGARIFIALANHHDGFDTWNSRHHEWNAVRLGPHRDVIGAWAKEARRHGLRFGVTVHQARNWWWFQPSHGSDRTGPQAGVPYDGELTRADGKGQWWEGLDPQQLYGVKHPADALPDPAYAKNFYDRTRDLIDQHNPDLLYFDNALFPLGWAGMQVGAYFYNHSRRLNGGRVEAVCTIKNVPPDLQGTVVADIERGLSSDIRPHPWQSETCIGQWHYQRALFNHPGEYGGYMHPREVIHWLIDTVSKNGTFVLNIPGKPDGTIDRKEAHILDEIGDWFWTNGEAIYETRPWKVFGEGPNMIHAGSFQGNSIRRLGVQDVRFTQNKSGKVIYALPLGWPWPAWRQPRKGFTIQSLGTSASTKPGKIARVQLLGTDEKMIWRQSPAALEVALPLQFTPRSDYAVAFKITLE